MSKSIKQGIQNAIKELFELNTTTNNTVFTNKTVQDSYNQESQAEFDEQILDYEERIILLEVGE